MRSHDRSLLPKLQSIHGKKAGFGEEHIQKRLFLRYFLGFEDSDKTRLLHVILDEVEANSPEKVAEIRGELGGSAAVPKPLIQAEIWNSARLNTLLEEIDT